MYDESDKTTFLPQSDCGARKTAENLKENADFGPVSSESERRQQPMGIGSEVMDVLVINLASRPDRLAFMDKQLTEFGVGYRVTVAVNGRDPNSAVDMGPPVGTITGRPRTRLEYSAFSSHRLCWKTMIDEDIPVALILEDDVLLAPDIARVVETSWLPSDADIVKLETTKRYVEVHGKQRDMHINRDLGLLAGRHMGAAGYIVTRKAAEKLWDASRVPCDQIDHFLFTPSSWQGLGLTVYQADPAPIVQGMYEGEAQSLDWAISTVQSDRDLSGNTMKISNTRLYGGPEEGGLKKHLRTKTILHAYRALRSRVKKGAYKRIQFG